MAEANLNYVIVQFAVIVFVVSGQEIPRLHYTMIEEELPGTFIGNIPQDANIFDNYSQEQVQTFQYGLLRQSEYFSVDETSGVLKVKAKLDRDAIAPRLAIYSVHLQAAILRPIAYYQPFDIIINVVDINDNTPKFPQKQITLTISELARPGVSFVLPSAHDPDSNNYGIQEYKLVSNSSKFDLQVSNSNGGLKDIRLVLRDKLDRELSPSYHMHVMAFDGGVPPNSGVLDIEVEVSDINDNSPVFDKASYEFTVSEDFPVNTSFGIVSAKDLDEGINGEIDYKLSDQTIEQFGDTFFLNSESGELFVKTALDFEKETIYHLLVVAQDRGPNSVQAHAKVVVRVTDVNDHSPEVTVTAVSTSGRVEVSEWDQPGTFIAHIFVEDQDGGSGGEVNCSLNHPAFILQSFYGQYRIITATKFDREVKSSYEIGIECSDKAIPPLKTKEIFTITVTDENDHAPVFSKQTFTVAVTENSVNHDVLLINASDQDIGPNAKINYFIAKKAEEWLSIDPNSGMIRTKAPFDYEKMTRMEFEVIAADSGTPPLSASATVSLIIVDQNDEAPAFSLSEYSFGTFENQPIGTEVGTINATDSDMSPYDQFVFSIDPQHNPSDTFNIDSDTGKITTRRVLDREYQSAYSILVWASDTSPPYPSSSATVKIYVADKNDNAPLIIFPSQDNKTLQVASNVPLTHIFGRVLATDADLGNNGKLAYSIAKGDEEGVFDIDSTNGIMSVNTDLSSVSKDNFTVLVMVRDWGKPRKSAVAPLLIFVNRSSSLAENVQAVASLRYHEMIITVLGAVTAVLVAILVLAIICVKLRQIRQAKDTSYLCMHKFESSSAGRGRSGVETNSVVETDLQKKLRAKDRSTRPSAFGPLGCSNSEIERSSPLSVVTKEQQDLRISRADRVTGREGLHSVRSPVGNSLKAKLEQLYPMLRADSDSTSTSSEASGEGSNTDSGRGASEEGDGKFCASFDSNPTDNNVSAVRNTPHTQCAPNATQKSCLKNTNYPVSKILNHRPNPAPSMKLTAHTAAFLAGNVAPQKKQLNMQAHSQYNDISCPSGQYKSPQSWQDFNSINQIDIPSESVGQNPFTCADISAINTVTVNMANTEDIASDDDTSSTSGSFILDNDDMMVTAVDV